MEILALLDRPSAKSLGIVPFIGRKADGTLVVSPPPKRHGPVTPEVMADLCASGHALDVTAAGAVVLDESDGHIAGWLGAEFAAQCRALGLELPDMPDAHHAFAPQGTFWIDSRVRVYQVLLEWHHRAAPRAFKKRDRAVADLMAWALPDLQETQAALWWTRETDEDRERYLSWLARVAQGRGSQLDPVAYAEVLKSIVRMHVARKNSGE